MKKICLAFVFLIEYNIIIHAQVITTFVGTGIAGFSGDGGLSVFAQINTPYSISFDNIGNQFIAEYYNNRIRKINAVGVINTIAGTGSLGIGVPDGTPASVANLGHPSSLTVDLAGNIYFLQSAPGDQSRILKINILGIITTYAGHSTSWGYSGDGGPATAALLSSVINNITTDISGNLYVTDYGNSRVRKVNALGIISTIAGNGTPGYSGDGGHATNARLRPRGIHVDAVGNIYISDKDYSVVRKVDPLGIITTVAGTGIAGFSGDGGSATTAMLSNPEQIATDSAGNLFICDMLNRRVRKVSPSGIITSVAGNGTAAYAGDGGPATACSLRTPMGIAIISGCGERIYISDYTDHRVREIVYYNNLPTFTAGHTHHITICEGAPPISLDSMLTITDADMSQPETWSLIDAPAHGTVSAAYSATSTGGSITPSGLIYTPPTGASGPDTFRIIVNDCGNAPDTAVFYVHILPLPYPGVIQNMEGIPGIDTVCVGDTVRFTDTVIGGVWGMYNTKATVSATGVVKGITPGADTISYTVTNSCGPSTATRAIMVKDCTLGIGAYHAASNTALSVFPNPNDGTFTITLPDGATNTTQIVVTNTIGEKVKEITVAGTTTTLKLDVPAGIYFISAFTDQGRYNAKVVVVR